MSLEKILKGVVIAFLMTSLGLSKSVRESFDYAPGSLDVSGDAVDGWGSPWMVYAGSPDLMNIVEGSQELPGIPTSGNSLMGNMTAADGDERAYRELDPPWPDDGSTYWISFLMDINNVNSNDQSWQGVSLFLNDGTELCLFGKVWGSPYLGVIAHTAGNTTTPSALTWEVRLAWTVVRINMSGDDQYERCFMWINPNPVSEPDTAIADVKTNLQMNTGFERVVVHFGKYLELETFFDELRLGTSFKEVSSQYTSVSQHENQLPNNSELSYNYPNPFNPKTTIGFNLKNPDHINLKIYDLKGREITTLTDGYLSAGKHGVQWDASEQPSGIYFYVLQAGEHYETKKMTLQK
jgi:hypothetical protein